MAAAFPSGNPGNTYVPSFEASGSLVVSFSRNPKDFALNKYITLVPVKQSTGYYLKLTPSNAARVINSSLADVVWPDGNDAPTGEWNAESHEFVQFATKRYAYPFRLGYKAVEQAVWKILAQHAAIVAQQAMTGRTLLAVTALETAGNYASTHTDTAANWGGGFLNAGTATNPILKKALNAMAQRIQKSTLGMVRPQDLVVVMNPVIADELGRSQEVHAYLKESPAALAQVRGDSPSQNGVWGLPDQIYGYKIAVEDAVRNTALKGATDSLGYIKSSNNLQLIARPGSLVGTEGAPSFSFLHLWAYEEMTVESKDDPDNRRHSGRVVDDFSVDVVSSIAGCNCTAVLS